jgi:phosphoenolpyruvate carboxykinase (GTP)
LLIGVERADWRDEAALIPAFYERFGERLPAALWAQYEALVARLGEEDETAPPKLALSA